MSCPRQGDANRPVPLRRRTGRAQRGKGGGDQPVRQLDPAQRPADGTKHEHRGGMGEVDLCPGPKHQGARCPGRHGRLDQVPGTEHPHHRASTRTRLLAGAPADYRAGGADQDCPVSSSRQ